MREALAAHVARLVGAKVAEARAVGGGSIGESHRVRLASGERCFVKDYRGGPLELPQTEASGLRWLAEADALPVAEVMAVSDTQPVLVLRWIDSAPRARDFSERLGRGLASLHAYGAPGFGLDGDNFIGSLPQSNAPCASWPEFYAERRLEPLLRAAHEQGRLSGAVVRDAARLMERLPERCGPDEPPARLHGDLWSGNLMVDETGAPCLVDPAVYGGHREMDLAMMRLFGGFDARTFDAYHEALPLAPGHAERVTLYQLYPVLVHVVLFGGHYADQLARDVRSLL